MLETYLSEREKTSHVLPPWLALGLSLQNIVCCQNITLINTSTQRITMKTNSLVMLICSIITILIFSSALIIFIDNTDQPLLVNSTKESEVNSFNTSFQPTMPTKETAATSTDDSGYEWYKQGEENWYRSAGSYDEWVKFEN